MSRVDRINQLEAPKIDEECLSILQEQILQGHSIWKNVPLPGHSVQNIQFSNGKEDGVVKLLTKKQKILYFLLDVVGRYLYERLKIWLDETKEEDMKKSVIILKKLVNYLEKVYKFLDLLNFLSFLKTYKYRNLIERLLKIQYSYIREKYNRFLDFELMTRTIIWNVVADFLSFCLPYIRYGFGEMVKRFFFFTTFMGSISMDLEDSDKKCGICMDEHVSMPYWIPRCHHKFCYFCIKTYMNEHKTERGEQVYKCPKCRIAFSEIESMHKRERKSSGVF